MNYIFKTYDSHEKGSSFFPVATLVGNL